jgi:hypothetical protein
MSIIKKLAVGAFAVLSIFKSRSRSTTPTATKVAPISAALPDVETNAVLAEAVPVKAPKKRRRTKNRRSSKHAKHAKTA